MSKFFSFSLKLDYELFFGLIAFVFIVVHHAVSLLVSAAFTDGTVRSLLMQQSNFKPWLQQLVLLAKEVNLKPMVFCQLIVCLSFLSFLVAAVKL